MEEGTPAKTGQETSFDERLARIEAQLDASAAKTGKSPVERALKFLPLLAASNFLVAVPAFVISVAVAYFTFIQAEATEKMQIAAVWPHVAYESTNRGDAGEPLIRLSLTNKGVGPAHIRGMEIRYRDKSYTQFQDILGACCSDRPQDLALGYGSVIGEVIRPGENVMFAQIDPAKVPADAWQRFDAERTKIGVRLCYCSVFDDCWIAGETGDKPRPVEVCPANWAQFTGSPRLVAPAGD
jgi:hypothetical protein